MRYILAILLGLFMVLGSSLVNAQQAPVLELSEEQAVALALQQNPQLQAAQAQAAGAQARFSLAKSETALQITGTGVLGVSTMPGTIGVPGLMSGTTASVPGESGVQLGAMALYPISTGGRLQSSVRAAERQLAAMTSQIAVTRINLARDARVRYAECVEALAMQRVAEETLTAQQEATKVAQQYFDVGKIPKFDLLRSQADLANAQQRLSNATAEVVVTKAELASILAMPITAFETPEQHTVLTPPPTNTLDTALATRPELHAAQQFIEAMQATVQARQAQYRVQVYAFGMIEGGVTGDANRSLGMSAGVLAGLPIADGGRRKAEVQEAEQDVQYARAMRESVELQVQAEVIAAEARVAAALRNIDTARSQVTAAAESYTAAQIRYQAGRSIMVELLDALQARTEAEQSLVAAQAQYRKALAELYRAMGIETIIPAIED